MNNVIRIEERFPLQVVSMSPERAKQLMGLGSEPRDLGTPPYPDRYAPGARVYGWKRGAT
jgi:hypothetical protein